jgi:hypothetical protein
MSSIFRKFQSCVLNLEWNFEKFNLLIIFVRYWPKYWFFVKFKVRWSPKDPWFSLLNAVLLAKEESLPISNVLGSMRPAQAGLELKTSRMLSESTTTSYSNRPMELNEWLYKWMFLLHIIDHMYLVNININTNARLSHSLCKYFKSWYYSSTKTTFTLKPSPNPWIGTKPDRCRIWYQLSLGIWVRKYWTVFDS